MKNLNTNNDFSPDSSEVLWNPDSTRINDSKLMHYMSWLKSEKRLDFEEYHDLWLWSVNNNEEFWESLWEYFDIGKSNDYSEVLAGESIYESKWFGGTKVNYSEKVFRKRDKDKAIIAINEDCTQVTVSYEELYSQVANVASYMKRVGVVKGDRVAAYITNSLESVVAFLATSSIGAIWSSCSPEFGVNSVVQRFGQIEPKMLIASNGYRFAGKNNNRIQQIDQIINEIPSIKHTILVETIPGIKLTSLDGKTLWDEILMDEIELEFEQVEFDHPLWILYSSGTTGRPKPIVHGHGGILLEHYKTLSFHLDVQHSDRFFWFTTVGWMMWNVVVSGLLVEATIVLYDGSPTYPSTDKIWEISELSDATYVGLSAPYINACIKNEIVPKHKYKMSSLKGIGSTGAPLSDDGFKWIYTQVKSDVHLGSYSGGTDLCTGFVGPVPILPVKIGEIQARTLGAQIEAFNESGESIVDSVGELVITKPMPSMPVFFWGDDGSIYKNSYFEVYQDIWRHGDWIEINSSGGCKIYGRSDSTLNRSGIRMGTSEFYEVLDTIPEIVDSIVIDTGFDLKDGKILLFVQLQNQLMLNPSMKLAIVSKIKSDLSTRYIPNSIFQVSEIPTTLNGKKLEIPIKKILNGTDVYEAVNLGTVKNPESLNEFIKFR
ncbi:MAG: acetoacetate--CoA ligase [SAR202 cluster bacterium]|nr:acetoacetate--CoA ligase [SAR202 cluster bacterium]|tara:strand:- start:942 stop:2918 length:1977 start_codon:yes stop_codon:yes gene_type:complete